MSVVRLTGMGWDTFLRVLEYLDAESLARLCCTSRDLKVAAETSSLWNAIALERWHHINVAAFSEHQRGSVLPSCATAQVEWKSLVASGNGWNPPTLRHTSMRYSRGDTVRALRPLWLSESSASADESRLAPGDCRGPLLLATAKKYSLEVRCISSPVLHGYCAFPTTQASDAPAHIVTALSYSSVPDGACSVAWMVGGDSFRGGSGAAVGPDEAPKTKAPPSPTHFVSGTNVPTTATATTASADSVKLTLAVGTERGTLEWYEYSTEMDSNSRSFGGNHASCSSATAPLQRLRRLGATRCDSSEPLVELHLLPASGVTASADGRSGGGLLAALQRARHTREWGISRSAVQLYDVTTQRHVSTVRDPFESHRFVCCCPAVAAGGHIVNSFPVGTAGSEGPTVDPHVLLVGSVHSALCRHCGSLNMPSLCGHKPRSATAALYTLDVRCSGGGLTQRFGLAHCSLYPRLATAREHYVFTSHAGTALEVHDRRVMSVPLYTCARLPWPSYGDATDGDGDTEEYASEDVDNEQQQVDEQEEAASPHLANVVMDNTRVWRDRPSVHCNRHLGLSLEANNDVLLGRSDNGTLWLWDLSMTLGWACGPERSGLWHWMYEGCPFDDEAVAEDMAAAASRDGGCYESGFDSGPVPRAATSGGAVRRAESAAGEPVCLGSLRHRGIMPMCALAMGASTAIFSLGVDKRGRECAVASVVTG